MFLVGVEKALHMADIEQLSEFESNFSVDADGFESGLPMKVEAYFVAGNDSCDDGSESCFISGLHGCVHEYFADALSAGRLCNVDGKFDGSFVCASGAVGC